MSKFAFSMHFHNTELPIIDYGHIEPIMNEVEEGESIQMKGRNSRKPKKANHGARPCSSYMRQMKKKGWYHILRGDNWTVQITFIQCKNI